MADPTLYTSGLITYLSAPPNRAGAVARRLAMRAGSPYDPRTDYWKRMRPALVADRATTRDGSAVWAAAENATPTKQSQYTAVARNWETIIPRWDGGSHVALPTAALDVGGLQVAVPASFAEQHPDGLEVVFTYLNTSPVSDHVAGAVLRLHQRLYPEAAITFVDAHRPSQLRTCGGRPLDQYDAWLDQAGMYLAHVLAQHAA